MRTLLRKQGWRERLTAPLDVVCSPPQLFWGGSTTGRKLFKEEAFYPWQMLNHFPRSGSIGSKSSLLWNLRDICAGTNSQNEVAALHSFLPRTYDLRSAHELRGFLLDFAVTRAEGQLRSAVNSSGIENSAVLLRTCRLLARLSHAQVQQSEAVNTGTSASTRQTSLQDLTGLTHEDEWVLQAGLGDFTEAKELLARLMAGKDNNEDGLLLSALTLEGRWWLEHLQKQEQRQFSLNGVHGFWILKDPALNCGRGVRTFSELLPLLHEAERADWQVIVQKYMERPLLLKERKCDVRLWVLVTSWNPAVVWVWPEPYLRLASKPFTWESAQVADPFVHLTNRAVQKRPDDSEASPRKPGPLEEDEAHIWLLPAFLEWAEAELTDLGGGARQRWEEHTWPLMLEAVRTCVWSCKEDVGAHPRGCFELFGFDFLLDTEMKPWLLEANSSPDLCEDAGPSLRRMTEAALSELLELVLALGEGQTLPQGGPACRDEQVPGSGSWHLILREEAAMGIKELHLRRAIRAGRRPRSVVSLGPSKRLGRSHHAEVLNATLGSFWPGPVLWSPLRRQPTPLPVTELAFGASPGRRPGPSPVAKKGSVQAPTSAASRQLQRALSISRAGVASTAFRRPSSKGVERPRPRAF